MDDKIKKSIQEIYNLVMTHHIDDIVIIPGGNGEKLTFSFYHRNDYEKRKAIMDKISDSFLAITIKK